MEQQRKKQNDLTTGSIWAKLALYFLPIAAGTVFQQLYNAVDGIVVGKFVGTQALAAVGGSAANIYNTLVNFFVAVAGGGSIIIAQHFGAKNEREVSKSVHTAMTFALLCGIGISILGFLFAPDMLRWMKTPEDTFENALRYLRVIFLGATFTVVFNMGSGVLRAVGDSRRPFIYLTVCCGLNIILDLTFVIFLGLEVLGVAIATIVSQAISAALILVRLFREKQCYRLQLKYFHIHLHTLQRILRLGIPLGLQSLMYSASNILIQVGVNSLGTTVVAGWSLSGKVDGFYWALTNASGTAIANFVGQNYGAGLRKRVNKSIKVSFVLFMGITIFMSCLILTAGHSALVLFSDDAATRDVTWYIMKWFVPFYCIWTVLEIFSGTLRGMGETTIPFIITAIGICLVRTLWQEIVFTAKPTLDILCMNYPISWVITAIAMAVYYFASNKKRVFPEAKKE